MYNWTEQNNKLQKTFKFRSFLDAIEWMKMASVEIDKLDHHPEWTNIYNKVHVMLCTHSEGNIITDKDREMAKILDSIPA